MQEYNSLKTSIDNAYTALDIDELQATGLKLDEQINSADFWSDNENAQKVTKEKSSIDKRVELWQGLKTDISDLVELANIGDGALALEIAAQFQDISKRFDKAKTELQFSGPYDKESVILSIFAGAGGTDAQDWAGMLLRMYSRWAENNGLIVSTIDHSAGDEAGLKSVTIEISGGSFLFGRMKSENGVHRLVRLSPFNADSLRQTSFARVETLPKIESPDILEIDEKDLKIDVYRSGGKGGQSVNTTDSAVRITHLPTGVVVAIQNERSQLQNRETAMTILRSKLAQLQLEQHKEHLSELKGPNEQAAWGNQIRNYVLHPYSMVKDVRTKHETSDVNGVLDGDIDQFMQAYLDYSMK